MNPSSPSSSPQTLADYVAVVRRRKWLVLLPVVIVPLVALFLSLLQSAQYQATANVVLSQTSVIEQVTGITDPTAAQNPAFVVATQAALARLPQVVSAAVTKAGVPGVTAAELLNSSTVSGDPNSNQLHFTVSAAGRQAAVALASAYGASFIKYQAQLQTLALQRARAQILNRLAQLRSQGEAKTPLYSRLAGDAQQLSALELLRGSNSLLNPPQTAVQTKPRLKRNLALGLVVGLVIGLGLAFLAESFDRRVRADDEIERELGLPVLARLPEFPARETRGGAIANVTDVGGTAVEAYRRLRTRLELANLEVGARTIMVTSAVKREGKSTLAASLGASLASAGTHVILVDLDLREPAIAELLGVSNRRGLVDVLRTGVSLDTVILPAPYDNPVRTALRRLRNDGSTDTPQLEVVPAGSNLPDDPTQVVVLDALWALIDELATRCDLVLIDAPPLLAVAESMLIAARVDALLVASRVGVVPRRALREFRTSLDTIATPKLGLVIAGAVDYTDYGYGNYGYIGHSHFGSSQNPLLGEAAKRGAPVKKAK
jgi:Mrp family chromosome partitioning ATPase